MIRIQELQLLTEQNQNSLCDAGVLYGLFYEKFIQGRYRSFMILRWLKTYLVILFPFS